MIRYLVLLPILFATVGGLTDSTVRAQTPHAETPSMPLSPAVARYVTEREAEFNEIPEDRRQELAALAAYIRKTREAGAAVKLTFICTHNSRRSHLSQIWAAVAAIRYGLSDVRTFSGGTEATAFNPRAVAALRRAGLGIVSKDKGENPNYLVTYARQGPPLDCFSKVYSDPPNPQSDFCAVMVCSSADRGCPTVAGAAHRVAIPYEDPKVADGTDQEESKYDERCAQICREFLYAFSLVP